MCSPWLNIAAVGLVGCEAIQGDLAAATHPCVGHRTDVVHVEGEVIRVGCGSTAEGVGLFESRDRGATWAEVAGFETFRVSDVRTGPDGVISVAGADTASADRVRALGGDRIFASEGQTWNSFHVGAYARTPAGLEIAESLTGYDLAAREGGAWTDGYGWWPEGSESFQILGLALSGERLIGVGSTIVQPPHVFVQADGPGFRAAPVALAAFRGELGAVSADGPRLAVGGVDQDRDVGVIFATDGDPHDAGGWLLHEVAAAEPTWVRAVCREGDRILAAGEYSTRGAGLLLESLDGGATWSDITPEGSPSLTACALSGSARVVAGAEGWVGVGR